MQILQFANWRMSRPAGSLGTDIQTALQTALRSLNQQADGRIHHAADGSSSEVFHLLLGILNWHGQEAINNSSMVHFPPILLPQGVKLLMHCGVLLQMCVGVGC